MKEHKAAKTSVLPQYINSKLATERFLDALYDSDGEIKVTPVSHGIKAVHKSEYSLDGLDYFLRNKRTLRKEFRLECINAIGKDCTNIYFDIISNIWYDGMSSRTGKKNFPLLRSIEDYFVDFKRISKENINVRNQPTFGNVDPLFDCEVLDQIFKLNNRLVTFYLGEWIDTLDSEISIGVNDIYIRRGIVLAERCDGYIFKDQNYLNSYSLSFTISEQFSQVKSGIPTILNLPFNDCLNRIFFFSPFVKNLNKGLVAKKYEQLELGLVPAYAEMRMNLQDVHDKVVEYLLTYSTPY